MMYALMNFFPEFRVYTIVTGLGGAVCFFAWAYRVANKQQMIIVEHSRARALCLRERERRRELY